jgi:phage gpG-like protein
MSAALIQIARDDLRPKFRALEKIGRDTTPVVRAMGNTLLSITQRNFSSLGTDERPTPWPPKYGGKPATLKQSGLLWHSFHLTVTPRTATVANPTKYAAIHQFGGIIRAKGKALVFNGLNGKKVFRKQVKIPARPFYPIINGQLTPSAAKKIADAGERVITRLSH